MLATAGTLLCMLSTSVSSGQDLGPKEPIRPDFVRFLQAEFSRVPAAYVVAHVSKSTCQEMRLPSSTAGTPQIFLCNVDLGCNDIAQVPVGVLPNGNLAFFPDTPEEVIYFACPASISDPNRRAEIEKKLALPPLTIRKIN
jgi:hypothetical protein